MTTAPDFLFSLTKPKGLLEHYYYSMQQRFFLRESVEQDNAAAGAAQVMSDEEVSLLVCQLSVARMEPELLSINSVLRKLKLQVFLSA